MNEKNECIPDAAVLLKLAKMRMPFGYLSLMWFGFPKKDFQPENWVICCAWFMRLK
jgi:hypothetical protein